MKAALVIPPYEDFYRTPHRSAPLGMHVVRQICEAAGYQTVYYNFPADAGRGRTLKLPEYLSYLKEVMVEGEFGPASFFTRYRRWGADAHSCAGKIMASNPDVIMISCFAYAYSDHAVELIRALRDMDSRIPILAGGAGVSALPDRFASADAALAGEAEAVLPALFNSWGRRAPSREQVCRHSADANLRSAQADEIIPVCIRTQTGRHGSTYSAAITRGCPMHCSFCSAHLCHGSGFRAPPLELAVETCASSLAQSGTSGGISLNIEDDNILAEPGYLTALLTELRRKYPEMSVTAENGIDYRFLDIPLLDKLISLGFCRFNFSAGAMIEGDRRIHQPELLASLTRRCAEQGIPSITYAIVGYPGDTREQAVAALAFLASLHSLCGVSPFYAVPGIDGFTDTAGFTSLPAALCAGSSLYPWGGSLSTKELATLFRISRIIHMKKHHALNPEAREVLNYVMEHRKLCTMKGPERRIIELDEPVIDQRLSEEFFDITRNLETCRVPGSVKEQLP